MSTTPVPTTAAAHLAMVEALEHASTCRWCSNGDVCDDGQRPAEKLRAALEDWKKRPRMRDTYELISVVFGLLAEQDAERRVDRSFVDQVTHRTRRAVAILDAIEAALFATGPRTGGEAG